jgi:hypothetical protein
LHYWKCCAFQVFPHFSDVEFSHIIAEKSSQARLKVELAVIRHLSKQVSLARYFTVTSQHEQISSNE